VNNRPARFPKPARSFLPKIRISTKIKQTIDKQYILLYNVERKVQEG
jgi:hypothetical protein